MEIPLVMEISALLFIPSEHWLRLLKRLIVALSQQFHIAICVNESEFIPEDVQTS